MQTELKELSAKARVEWASEHRPTFCDRLEGQLKNSVGG
jgi:hypothetical protein